MRQLVLGDVHGGYRSMMQCFERSKFDYKKDELIVLGDIVDGWPETKECFNELLKIKNLSIVAGNHDIWALDWMKGAEPEKLWTSQGGLATMGSYNYDRGKVPKEHIALLEQANWYIEDDGKIFVHGGFDPVKPIDKQSNDVLVWDRTLLEDAYNSHKRNPKVKMTKYKEVYLGHTSTMWAFNKPEPVHVCEIWALDTGGGMEWKLSIMDTKTKKFWQSDVVKELYPGVMGR